MCKKRPEPRCAHHAKEGLRKAKKAITAAQAAGDANALAKARADYSQAKWDYYTTPEGQKFLKDKADEIRASDPETAAELDRMHAKAVAAREQQARLTMALKLGPPRPTHKVTPADADFPQHEVQAIIDDQPVGFIQWNHETGQIVAIDVLPEHRGQGIAQSMVDQARETAKKNGWVTPVKPQDEDDSGDWVAGVHDVPDYDSVEVTQETKPAEPQGWNRDKKEEVLNGTITPLREAAHYISEGNYRGVGQAELVGACHKMDYDLEQLGTQIYSDPDLTGYQKNEYIYQVDQARRDAQELRFMIQNNERQDRIDTVSADLRQRFMTLGERIAAD